MLNNSKKSTINCNGKIINLSEPIVMGILNITPDSFYKESRYNSEKQILARTKQIIEEGGKIIDIGAYSSRPGAADISQEEELKRLKFALEIINKNFNDIIISIDTFRSEIARQMVEKYGVSIINDISAGAFDKKMFQTIADLNIPYIMMHIKGNPRNMQENPTYKNLTKEIILYFTEKIQKLKLLGVKDIIIDPGFGFGKTIEHNYEILNNLKKFLIFDFPLLIGLSRKSMIYKVLDTTPEKSLIGTTVLNTYGILNGANILRVHDVKETIETIKLLKKLKVKN